MKNIVALAVLLVMVTFSPSGNSQDSCEAPKLSDQHIKEVIDKERASRTDLPTPFPKYRWLVRRQGCHYTYIEYAVPETPEENHIFTINQHGVIVDADSAKFKCPEKILREDELGKIVTNERGKRPDLPTVYAKHKTRVQRLRCLYLYFEYALPEKKGNYQVFTIDPFGEVLDFSRSQPY